jgi:hypothetical protein
LSQPGPAPRHTGLHEAGGVILEEHQVELLRALVEAHRSIEPRQEFLLIGPDVRDARSGLRHAGLPEGFMVPEADIRVLARFSLIDLVTVTRGLMKFSITPWAVKHYAEVLQRQGQPVERVEQAMRRLMDGKSFQSSFSAAYAKWAKAEELLWGADAQSQLTAIGHHCREAAQDFATALVSQHQPPDCPADPTSTVARLRAVLNLRRRSLPSTVHPFLDALLTYWGTVMDLHQRQEHGAQREGQPLTWEDGRRVVFQTLLVMYELDRALNPKAS